jgi:hypothetical protein
MSAMCGVASCACFGLCTDYCYCSDTPHGSVSLVSDVLEFLALAIFPVFVLAFCFHSRRFCLLFIAVRFLCIAAIRVCSGFVSDLLSVFLLFLSFGLPQLE